MTEMNATNQGPSTIENAREPARGDGDQRLRKILLTQLKNAYIMELYALQMNRSFATTTEDPVLRERLEQHTRETQTQVERLWGRLAAYNESLAGRGVVKLRPATFGKEVTDKMRGNELFKNARDAYTAEHLEIAVYEILERLAERAGDPGTAAVARRNCSEDAAMAADIAQHWDRVVEFMIEGRVAQRAAKAEIQREEREKHEDRIEWIEVPDWGDEADQDVQADTR